MCVLSAVNFTYLLLVQGLKFMAALPISSFQDTLALFLKNVQILHLIYLLNELRIMSECIWVGLGDYSFLDFFLFSTFKSYILFYFFHYKCCLFFLFFPPALILGPYFLYIHGFLYLQRIEMLPRLNFLNAHQRNILLLLFTQTRKTERIAFRKCCM